MIFMTKMIYAFCVCVFNLLQDIHQFALRQIDVYLSQARAQKNTHHYLLITPYILIQTQPVSHPLFIRFGCLFIFHAMYIHVCKNKFGPLVPALDLKLLFFFFYVNSSDISTVSIYLHFAFNRRLTKFRSKPVSQLLFADSLFCAISY